VKRPVAPVVATTVALVMLWPAAQAIAATAYVSDDLVLGVYAEQNGQGQRLATLHSGTTLETLAVNGDFTQVRLTDGTVGWVKSTYLTNRTPAAARVKELEEELDRRHATTPELAEAAAHTELTQLKRDLAAKQAELDAALAALAAAAANGAIADALPPGAPHDPDAPRTATPGIDATRAADGSGLRRLAPIIAAVVSLGIGVWAGYATVARRMWHKFGGMKVF